MEKLKNNEILDNIKDLTDAMFIINQLFDKFELAGIYFSRGDLEEVMHSQDQCMKLTDKQWDDIKRGHYWQEALPNDMAKAGWYVINDIITDLMMEEDNE